jgi:hypothetical protein
VCEQLRAQLHRRVLTDRTTLTPKMRFGLFAELSPAVALLAQQLIGELACATLVETIESGSTALYAATHVINPPTLTIVAAEERPRRSFSGACRIEPVAFVVRANGGPWGGHTTELMGRTGLWQR